MKRYLWVIMMVVLSACGAPSSTQSQSIPAATEVNGDVMNPTYTPAVSSDSVALEPATPVSANDVGAGASNAPVTATPGVTDTPIVYTATATPVLVAPQIATGWRFRHADMPGAVFMFTGVRCATNGADVSGEWLIEANPVIEGVPFMAQYVIKINPDQQSGTWQYQQFFVVDTVKSVARVAGQIAAVRVESDGSVAFDLRVEGGIEGVLITPDGEFPREYPYPVTTLTNLTWEPIKGSCP